MENLPALSTQLATMPDVLNQNTSLAERAVAKCRAELGQLLGIDLSAVDLQTMEGHDQTLASLQSKLKEAYSLMNDRRKPFTQIFDEIKARFTAEEKKVVSVGEEVKGLRDRWQQEKARRIQLQEKQKQEDLARQQAIIDTKVFLAKHINDKWAEAIVKVIYKLHDKYNSMKIDQLDAYGETLKKWVPAMDVDTWNSFLLGIVNPKPQLFTGEQLQSFLDDVVANERPRLVNDWAERLSQEKEKLIELIPSRKRELEKIASDEDAKEDSEKRLQEERTSIALQVEQEKQERTSAIQQAAESDKINASFDQGATATPVVGLSKGTVVKKKYQPKNHKGHVAIIQWWVTHQMPLMTLEELQSKLSFMRTSADKALNDGRGEIESDGLEVVEDYSTRSTRTKKEQAA